MHRAWHDRSGPNGGQQYRLSISGVRRDDGAIEWSLSRAIEKLANAHKRDDFTGGNHRIDSYFRETVSQDVKRKYATCFVASEIATDRVAGFYTLSSSNVPLTEVPELLAVRGGFRRRERPFFRASRSAILAQWPDFEKNAR